MNQFLHKTGRFHTTEGFSFLVQVIDVRRVFARVDFLIRPVNIESRGEVWVDANRVKLLDKAAV